MVDRERDKPPEDAEAALGPGELLRRRLREFGDSAQHRDPLLDSETEVVLEAAARLKRLGHSPAVLLVKAWFAEQELRRRVGLSDEENRWPTVEELTPLLAGSRSACPWPAADFIYAPSVTNCLGLLRQQNDARGSGQGESRPLPSSPEQLLWAPGVLDTLWNLRLLRGANRAMEASWAPKKDLDQLTEALRLNAGRPGRRPIRSVDHAVDTGLFAAYCAFHGVLRKAHREIPRRLTAEDEIRDALVSLRFPTYLIERLAQELHEHRSRRNIGLSLSDRAAMMLVELEGKRGAFGLPEQLTAEESMADEDVTQPLTVMTRKPEIDPPRTPKGRAARERAVWVAIRAARGRVKQLRTTWNAGAAMPTQ